MQDLDKIEKAIIGQIITEPNAITKVISELEPKHFNNQLYSALYNALLHMFKKGIAIDLITACDYFNKGEKTKAADRLTVIDMINGVFSAENIVYHARIVIEQFVIRRTINLSERAKIVLTERTADVNDVLNGIVNEISNMLTIGTSESELASDISERVAEKLYEISANGFNKDAIRSGFASIDNLIGGLEPQELMILAARPGVGKTAFALNVARNVASKGRHVLFFSLEMSKAAVTTRLICDVGSVNNIKIKHNTLTQPDFDRIETAVHMLKNIPIIIDETSAISLPVLRAKAMRYKLQKNIGLIVVDYLQLMKSGEKLGTREAEVSEISRGLKAIAKDLNLPIIALSQLNRDIEKRAGKKPNLSDLRESGSIEQDADMIVFLSESENVNMEVIPDGFKRVDVNLAKQRNGELGTVTLDYQGIYFRFSEKDVTDWIEGTPDPEPLKPNEFF